MGLVHSIPFEPGVFTFVHFCPKVLLLKGYRYGESIPLDYRGDFYETIPSLLPRSVIARGDLFPKEGLHEELVGLLA